MGDRFCAIAETWHVPWKETSPANECVKFIAAFLGGNTNLSEIGESMFFPSCIDSGAGPGRLEVWRVR
jgi:hypothetical protein